ncbi:hypothetical protein V8C40DRAFT_250722 [Trichoderma camerunense]
MAQLLVIDGQNSPQGEPNARAHPQHALRTLACLTTMHVSGPKHSPHVRPQCGARRVETKNPSAAPPCRSTCFDWPK